MSVGLSIFISVFSILITSLVNYLLWSTFITKQRNNDIVDKVYSLIAESVELINSGKQYQFTCQVKFSLIKMYLIDHLKLALNDEVENLLEFLTNNDTISDSTKLIPEYRVLFDSLGEELAKRNEKSFFKSRTQFIKRIWTEEVIDEFSSETEVV